MEIEKEVSILKEGWLHKRGEHIKTWRPRYFILKSNGNFLGYNNCPNGPTEIDSPNNLFFIKDSKILTSDKPKNNVFILKCFGEKNSSVERFFASSTRADRDDWIQKIQEASRDLDGQISVAKKIKENQKITLHDFEFLKILGKGTFGKVILCREHSTKRLCAMKILKKSLIIEKNEITHTETENKIMRNMKHPFITSLVYSFQTIDRLCLVMEYVNGGELFFHLAREKKFNEVKTRFYCAEIAYALGFLHENNIIYRDVKLENILLDSEGHIKLADFGLCKMNMDHRTKTSTFCGTLEYLAPEIISKESGYTKAVDWWALGVVMYSMLVGRLPFSSKCPESNNQDCDILFNQISNDEIWIPVDISIESKRILCQLLEKNPLKRLGSGSLDFEELKRHCFFTQIDWNKLKDKLLVPPFKPVVTSDVDTCYFEKEFTGEFVQLTPSTNDSSMTLLNNHFDSFSFYGSISSLNSHKSHVSVPSSILDAKSDKFDINSLQENVTEKRSLLKRSRLISHDSLNDESTVGYRMKRNDDNFYLASSAFPNIINFTDNSGCLRYSQAFFSNSNNNPVTMSTESFISTSDSANSVESPLQNIFMQALLNANSDMAIDEKMEV